MTKPKRPKTKVQLWLLDREYTNLKWRQEQINATAHKTQSLTDVAYEEWLKNLPDAPADFKPQKQGRRKKVRRIRERAA